ncbi:MAG: pantetheine-phosphate adenylyltransferase [Erysipelotrichaceae bacterium]|nr:pantetheine-phosphate adenylyltransferase [Erysipelotrichaceae bacterium]
MKIAVYPGSFDPITNGHIDVLKRALNVFDKVIVLVADNPNKKSKFTTQEKVTMIKEAIDELHLDGASVDSYSGLSVEYAKKHGAACLIRGLRAVTDFEYEFKLSAANHYIDSSIDEIFFMSHAETSFISSSVVDELYSSGVDISSLVPNSVIKMFKNK